MNSLRSSVKNSPMRLLTVGYILLGLSSMNLRGLNQRPFFVDNMTLTES